MFLLIVYSDAMLCYMLWKASWIMCTYDVNVNDSRGVQYSKWCHTDGSPGLQGILCGMFKKLVMFYMFQMLLLCLKDLKWLSDVLIYFL